MQHTHQITTRPSTLNRKYSKVAYGALSVLALALYANTATAQQDAQDTGPNWDTLDFQYQHPDYSDSDTSGHGFLARSFKQFNENGLLYVSAGTAHLRETFWNQRYKANTINLNLGAGGRFAVADSTDLFAVAGPSFTHVEVTGGHSESEFGFFAAGGVRSKITRSLEATAYVDYINIDGYDDTAFHVEGRYWFNKRFALSLGYSPDSEVDVYSIGFSIAL